jgi:adenylate cyclase
MPDTRVERRLVAIMSADVVGYTRLMADDEVATLDMLNAYRARAADLVGQNDGRVVDMVGDNLLAEFPSAVAAVRCGLEIQQELAGLNEGLPPTRVMQFRIGINIGDLIIDGDRIVGNGVNIAARIEATAAPGSVAMSGAVFDQIEGKLDIAVVDLGDHDLKNVAKPIRIFQVVDGETEPASPSNDNAPPAGGAVKDPVDSERHAIAVLPFVNKSSDPEQEYFSDGLSEDLITSLATLRIHPVIARNSSFAYRGDSVDVRQAGRELGAQYVVTGSVRKSGQRVRVIAELVDTIDGGHVWSDRFDREMKDLFELQDDVTVSIAGALGPALSNREIRNAMKRPPENLGAWDCIHRGIWHIYRYTKEDVLEGETWARRAMELQPDSSTAYSLLTFSLLYQLNRQWAESPEDTRAEAIRAANKAVELDNGDPRALTALGFACSMQGQNGRAVSALERAIAINPSSAMAFWALGNLLTRAGRPDEGIPMIEKAMRLSPQDNLMHEYLFAVGSAHLMAGRYPQAVEFAKKSLTLRADQPGTFRLMAAAYGHLGHKDEAADAVAEMTRLAPGISEENLKSFLPEAAASVYIEGLRKAGWQG